MSLKTRVKSLEKKVILDDQIPIEIVFFGDRESFNKLEDENRTSNNTTVNHIFYEDLKNELVI